MNEQHSPNVGTPSSNGAGGYVVHVDLRDGHIRTFGGFASENEARACIERGEGAKAWDQPAQRWRARN